MTEDQFVELVTKALKATISWDKGLFPDEQDIQARFAARHIAGSLRLHGIKIPLPTKE